MGDDLVLGHWGLARSICRRFSCPVGMERADLEQEALAALVGAARRFDPTRGVAFSTYATKVIRGELAKATARVREDESAVDALVRDDQSSGDDIDALAYEASLALSERLKELGDPLATQVALMRLSGVKRGVICSTLGISVGTYRHRLGKALQRLGK